jgi:hypothetical protein
VAAWLSGLASFVSDRDSLLGKVLPGKAYLGDPAVVQHAGSVAPFFSAAEARSSASEAQSAGACAAAAGAAAAAAAGALFSVVYML